MQPRVSVFIASYNGGALAAAACRSILAQTFRDLELVVVDDGSSEATRTILRQVASGDARMRFIEAEHRGQIDTLNAAIDLCRGDYIARLDHDDIAQPQRIALQAAYLDAHPDVVAVGTYVGKIDLDGRRLPDPRYAASPTATDFSGPRPRLVFLMGPTLMARADALRRVGGFRPQFRASEDRDLSWRLAALGRTANIQQLLVDHRDHPGSLSVKAATTQTFARLLADLSALAAHFGKDDTAALAKVEAGRDYLTAFAAYEALLSGVYPVRTFLLAEMSKSRFVKLGVPLSPPLSHQILRHVAARPFDLQRLKLLARLPSVAASECRSRTA